MIVEQIKSQLEDSQSEAKELREKVSDLQRQLTEERFDKQLLKIIELSLNQSLKSSLLFEIVDEAHCCKSW